MEELWAEEEKTQIRYNIGNARVRQKVGLGVSLIVNYRKDTTSAKERSDRVYLASWKQFQTAKELIARYCPKVKTLWKEK